MDKVYYLYLLIVVLAIGVILGYLPGAIQKYQMIKSKELEESQNVLLQDEKSRQLYVHQSHILMAGIHSATECINCGGNSKTSVDLNKLIVPCSMELSVYGGNR